MSMILKNTFKSLTVGDLSAGNYTQFEEDGTMVAYGNATCTLDELGDITRLKVVGNRIVYDDAENTLTFNTATVLTTDYVWTNIQLNHDRQLTEGFPLHVHWFQAENKVPNFICQYRWQKNDGSAKVTSWTNYKMNTLAFTYSSGTIHQICYGSNIVPPEGTSISDILQVRFTRDNANNSGVFSGSDTYTATVHIMSLDGHKTVNKLGSRQEYSY